MARVFGQGLVAFRGDARASERFGHLKIEVNVLVGLAERNFVQVNVNTRVVVKLAQLPAFGQLRFPFSVSRLWLWGWFGEASLRLRAGSRIPANDSNRSAHQFHLAEAVLDKGLEISSAVLRAPR